MQYKEMRKALKDAGVKPVPIKNTEMYQLYIKKNPDYDGGEPVTEEKVVSITKNDNMYTYIGEGDEPPHMTNFMGRQRFIRGELTEVTDKRVLSKIKTNSSFVKGSYDKDKLFENDDKAKKVANLQREEDLKTQIYIERENRKG